MNGLLYLHCLPNQKSHNCIQLQARNSMTFMYKLCNLKSKVLPSSKV